jgi:Na+/H+-translocating membrane pyrophosphatase
MAGRKKAPLHVPIALGVTAGLYAVSLAGVTALQHQADTVASAAQQPLADAISGLANDRASLETDLRATVGSLNAASDAYGTAAARSADLEASVAALATGVQAATGAAARIPQSALRLPTAPRTVTVVVAAPATQATTGASGKP